VIIGKLIPSGTGFEQGPFAKQTVAEVEPELPMAAEVDALLEADEETEAEVTEEVEGTEETVETEE